MVVHSLPNPNLEQYCKFKASSFTLKGIKVKTLKGEKNSDTFITEASVLRVLRVLRWCEISSKRLYATDER